MIMQPYSQDIPTSSMSTACSRRSDHEEGGDQASTIDEAIRRSQELLLSLQYPEGYWLAELESNVTITADTVLLYKIMGLQDEQYPRGKMEKYIRNRQCEHGGWELFYGDGGEVSVSTEAYIALRLLGVPVTDPAMVKAKGFILGKGGISKTRIFTKLCLAMLGCYDWRGIPSLPAWVMLLPNWFFTTIYDMSSWARGCTVPLIIVFDRKPVFAVSPNVTFDELYAEGKKNAMYGPRLSRNWTDIFVGIDGVLKLMEKLKLVPFRQRGIREAEKWVLERQEDTGDWAGIFPAMFYSLLGLKALGYTLTDPVIHRGLQALRDFSMETEHEYWVQPCISPVWDTGLIVRALVDSGLAPDHPALQRAGRWLLKKQITQPGDWAFRNKAACTGGWAFEFVNRWYPDVDDSAVIVMALDALQLPAACEPVKQGAISRAVSWIHSMQCKAGGWGAFDKDNDQDWLNATPYGDLKAMIDPNTSDVTARVLEMAGRMKRRGNEHGRAVLPPAALQSGMEYLRREQEKDGSWFGRWGVNYIYGTCGALVALSLADDPSSLQDEIGRGAKWLVQVQSKQPIGDGGWGETCFSYNEPSLKGRGDVSTPSQTAWGVLGLLAAGDALGKYEADAIEGGIAYLLKSQRGDGSWHEAHFTGTGFPVHFYLRYHFYALHFSLTALGRYRERVYGKHIMPSVLVSTHAL